MEYAIYRAIRSTGGYVDLSVPLMTMQHTYPNKSLTLSELYQFSEYPIKATIFSPTSAYKNLHDYLGFTNALDVEMYVGETWTLNNGSTIKFSRWGSKGVNVSLTNKSGVLLVGYNIQNSGSETSNDGNFYFIRGIYQDIYECSIYWQYVEYRSGLSTFSLYDEPVPASIIKDKSSFFYDGATPVFITNDPYGDGGVSSTGGGNGTFSETGDNIDIPSLPTLSAVNAGFITLFNPTLTELNNLSTYMWSDLFDLNGWRKIFADPMDAILGLSIVPVAVPSNGTREVTVGNISTGVSMTVASTQYVTVDCGTLDVKEFWGAYLDYDPYTKAELYLPYVGTHAIATDDIMNKSVHVIYHVDILSGSCCAYVQCDNTVLYTFLGQCSSSIPITGDNWTNVVNGALSIAGSIGSMVATGGVSAPMAIGNIASTSVNTMKPTVEKSGAMSGTGGMLGVQTPYLILTRPKQALPGDQYKFTGYPSFITKKLSALSGYTEIDSIHLENIPATQAELFEIENLLKSGVIF